MDLAEEADIVNQVRAINAAGQKNIADVCKELNCKMIYISTDNVFNGQGSEPWQPDCKIMRRSMSMGRQSWKVSWQSSQTLEKYFIVRMHGYLV